MPGPARRPAPSRFWPPVRRHSRCSRPTTHSSAEGARPGVHHIALEVDDVYAAAGHMTAAGVAVDDTRPSPRLGKARRRLLSPRATAGVRTYLTEPIASPAGAGDGRVERIDHIGVASADNAAALDVFCTRLGCPLESTQTDVELRVAVETFTSDRYGVVSHTRPARVVGGLRWRS